ncbi:MAG: hypothetical protein AB1656_01460 [Candidatus Omnitrophota bacterium]
MPNELNRRTFIQQSILTSAGGALAMRANGEESDEKQTQPQAADSLPKGKIGDLMVSRILLGGNLLTHFTHSRDLKYVYNLAAQYNTEKKIHETLAVAEAHGVDTLVIHTQPWAMNVIKKYRDELGGKIKWIICPTAEINDSMEEYRQQVQQVVEMGVEAIYLWGVRGDQLVSQGRVDLITKAVETAKQFGVPSGVGAHNIQVIAECEKNKIAADFYIKTFHHHNYPTGPKPEELKSPIAEIPGYWCSNPQEVIEVMKPSTKPWIAFKVMAAGAIPPENAFQYAFDNGADHIIAGMFDFEIAEDVRIAKKVLANVNRTRPWRS